MALVAATKEAVDLVRAALERDDSSFMGESPLATGIRTALLAQVNRGGKRTRTRERHTQRRRRRWAPTR